MSLSTPVVCQLWIGAASQMQSRIPAIGFLSRWTPPRRAGSTACAGPNGSRSKPPMDSTSRQSWFRAVVFIGALYALVGITFALPASHARAWRLAAWVVSGMVYAVHIGFERFRLRNSCLLTALHVASA